jgi:hypothetical protein
MATQMHLPVKSPRLLLRTSVGGFIKSDSYEAGEIIGKGECRLWTPTAVNSCWEGTVRTAITAGHFQEY